jgi:lipid-A-disaccharide synthase
MQDQGAFLVKHYRYLAFMGFLEVLSHLPTILGNLRFCKKDIQQYRPDVVVLIDYPGFNLRIAEFAHRQGFRVFYYISPQLWAWKSSRVKIIKKAVDRMFVILPFEKDFYSHFHYSVDFVGHPLLDAISSEKSQSREDFLHRNHLDARPVIAVLPGSREMEVSKMLSIMLGVTSCFTDFQFVIGAAPSLDAAIFRRYTDQINIHVVHGQTYNLLRHSIAALVTSGTATLETALFGVPQVVCYRGNAISYQIARWLVKVKYISLVNLIADQPLVMELIQNELNEQNLITELRKLLDPEKRREIEKGYEDLKVRLGGRGASRRTADLMVQYLFKKKV